MVRRFLYSGEKGCAKESRSLTPLKWATVYRALKPFLRPFGDSGEGRLDFYHRSLSKAVRHKYFLKDDDNEEDKNSRDVYYWWHKKLADFFEYGGNRERKLEEYPHHLIKINDTKRLQEFLTEWGTIDQLYNENVSNLLAYWKKAGGYDVMETQYKQCLKEVENKFPDNKEMIALRMGLVAGILDEAGRYKSALEYLQSAMDIEENELGARPERMVEMYDDAMNIYTGIVDSNVDSNVEQTKLLELRPAIDFGRKSLTIRKTLSGERHKFKLGSTLSQLAGTLMGWSERGGTSDFSAREAIAEGKEHIKEAIRLFNELGDHGQVAWAIMRRGNLEQRGSIEKLKDYEDAMKLCIQAYGEYHTLTAILLANIAIYYEDKEDWYKAYSFYKRALCIMEEIYGYEHPNTKRVIKALEDPQYMRIADEVEDL